VKKFFIGLLGILLLVIYIALVIATFAVTTVSKILIWLTNNAQNVLEKIKGDFQYGES
jgi:lipopolysaccharide export LptBFGC system permease protein LptF